MKRGVWLVALLGCVREDPGPEPVALGEDTCATCRMIISEARYAAQMRIARRVEKFDDIGCLLKRLSAPAQVWVADQLSGEWIDARAATFVRSEELRTPMASGLAAFRSRSTAEAFAREHRGKLLSFEEVTREH